MPKQFLYFYHNHGKPTRYCCLDYFLILEYISNNFICYYGITRYWEGELTKHTMEQRSSSSFLRTNLVVISYLQLFDSNTDILQMKAKICSACTFAVQPAVHFRSSGRLLSSNTVPYPYKHLSFVYFVVVFSLHSQERAISFFSCIPQIQLFLLFLQMLQVRIEWCVSSYRATCNLLLFHTQETWTWVSEVFIILRARILLSLEHLLGT